MFIFVPAIGNYRIATLIASKLVVNGTSIKLYLA